MLAAMLMLLAAPAHAQLCKDEKYGGSGTLSCDMTYYNSDIKCHSPYKKLPDGETAGTMSPCPKEPMPMKNTALKSFKDLSPLHWAFPRDPKDQSQPYTGIRYVGTEGDRGNVLNMLGTHSSKESAGDVLSGSAGSQKNVKPRQFAQCVAQISLQGSSVEEQAKIVRLQLDNCANQYILQSAVAQGDEKKKQDPRILSLENPDKPEERISLKTHCQPLLTKPDVEQEYSASYYIEKSWNKLLGDPNKKDPKKPAEPQIKGLSLANPIPYPSDAARVTLSDIAKVKYEEIIDPSHPFSPRWDYEYNERDKYSPLTVSYSNDAQNSVFCAGDRENQKIKVDILTFREDKLKFDDKIKKRIDWNKNCKANSGLQANPCCKPNILTNTCKLMPCSECYDTEGDAWKTDPVCSTSYSQNEDRKSVITKFLPVHPTLRFPGLKQALSGNLGAMNLSNLPANAPVGAVASTLQSQVGLLNSLPGNLPISSALPLLSGQAGLISGLPTSIPIGQLGGLMGMPAGLLNSLPSNLPIGQVQQLLTSQGAILNVLPSGAQGLGSLGSLQGIVSSLPVNTPLSQITTITSAQSIFANSLPAGINTAQAATLIAQQAGGLTGITNTLPIGNAIPGLKAKGIDVSGLSRLPATMTVGDVRAMQAGISQGITSVGASAAGANIPFSAVAQNFDAQSAIVQQLPNNVPLNQVGTVLGSVQNGIPNLGNMGLGQAGTILRGQAGNVLQRLPNDMGVGQLGAVYGSASNMLGQLGAIPNFGTAQLQGLLQSQLGNLAQLGNIPISNVRNLMSSQLGSITGALSGTGLAGSLGGLGHVSSLTPIGNISSAVDGATLTAAPGVSDAVATALPAAVTELPLPAVLSITYTYPRKAMCNPKEFAPNSDEMADLCTELRKPFTPLNKLKMRYHNPQDTENDVLYEGVPEGLTFKEYFDNRMPYPRLWDAGQSIQKTNVANSDAKTQDPLDDSGQYTAIVGIGREGAPKAQQSATASDDKKPPKDERCRYGGWGGAVTVSGISIPASDPITSWTELKLTQARSIREFQLGCLPRYEKMFKPGATEAGALLKTGANWNSVYVSCPKGDGSFEYKTAAEAKSTPCSAANNGREGYNMKQEGWSAAWRGYVGNLDTANAFPKFGGGAGASITGLDNAHCGDIIILDNVKDDQGKPMIPKLAVVTAVNLPNKSSCESKAPSNCAKEKNCYVDVTEYDVGKWPDACGTTDGLNSAITRRYTNPSMYPDQYKKEIEGNVKWTSNCAESKLTPCKMQQWGAVKLYRIADDKRQGAQPNAGGN